MNSDHVIIKLKIPWIHLFSGKLYFRGCINSCISTYMSVHIYMVINISWILNSWFYTIHENSYITNNKEFTAYINISNVNKPGSTSNPSSFRSSRSSLANFILTSVSLSSAVEKIIIGVGYCCLTFFLAISWREQCYFRWNDNDVGFVLEQLAYFGFSKSWLTETTVRGQTCRSITRTTRFSWFFLELTHWNNSPRTNMWLHSDTLT